MQGRSFIKTLVAGVVLALGAFAVHAQQSAFQPVNPPQPGGNNGQIEVIEFFSYGCPHCSEFEPQLSKWRAEQKKDVVFKRVPVSFGNPAWTTLSRVSITLNILGLSDKLDSAVFDAVQRGRVNLGDEKIRNEWLVKQGVDVKAFNNTWNSFSVDSQAKRAEQQTAAYKIMGVPSLTVNGKYVVEGGDPKSLQTVSTLINKERGAAAPASSGAPAAKPVKK